MRRAKHKRPGHAHGCTPGPAVTTQNSEQNSESLRLAGARAALPVRARIDVHRRVDDLVTSERRENPESRPERRKIEHARTLPFTPGRALPDLDYTWLDNAADRERTLNGDHLDRNVVRAAARVRNPRPPRRAIVG